MTALSGRPAPPKQVHRSAVPRRRLPGHRASSCRYSRRRSAHRQWRRAGARPRPRRADRGGDPAGPAVPGRCWPGSAGAHPIAVRLALRDLARYRARSGSALAAISLGVLIAVIVCVAVRGAVRRTSSTTPGPTWRPTSSSSTRPTGPTGTGRPGQRPSGQRRPSQLRSMATSAHEHRRRARLPRHRRARIDQRLAPARRGRAQLVRTGLRRHPAAAAGLRDQASESTPTPTSSPCGRGCPASPRCSSSTATTSSGNAGRGSGAAGQHYPCPTSECLANPVIQEVSALPSGTSAPNTVITEHAIQQLGLQRQRRPAG